MSGWLVRHVSNKISKGQQHTNVFSATIRPLAPCVRPHWKLFERRRLCCRCISAVGGLGYLH